jgi:hypothetical protein
VRVYELRVGDEDESVGVCTSFLVLLVSLHTSHRPLHVSVAYPVLPFVPIAALYGGIEGSPLTPVQHHPPQQYQYIAKCKQSSEAPIPSPNCIVSFPSEWSQPIQVESSNDSPSLVCQALWLLVCADGDAIIVVLRHRRRKEIVCCWRSIA